MPGLRRAYVILIVAVCFAARAAMAERGGAGAAVMPLSLEGFTRLVLDKSLRSLSANQSFKSAAFGRSAALRDLTWPKLTATASADKTRADDDEGTITATKTQQAGLSLSQPLLTGTNIGVTGTWTKTNTTTDVLGAESESGSRTVPEVVASVRQPIYLFTGNNALRSWREANLRWESDAASFKSTRLQIAYDARSLYYSLVLQRETSRVEEKKLESANLVNRATRALVRAGKLAEVELVRADIRAKRDVRRIQNSESTFQKALLEAKDLAGLPADAGVDLTTPLSYQPFTVPLTRIIELAKANNQALLNARRSLELARLSLARTREGDRPALAASGNYSLTRSRPDAGTPLDPTSWTVGLSMDYPLFDATQTRLRTRQAEAALTTARYAYEQQDRDLQVTIKNAYLELKRTEDQIADFQPQREAAERNVRAIRLQYENGLTRLSDVFDAENELRDLELEYLGLLVSFNTARDRLSTLVGLEIDEWR